MTSATDELLTEYAIGHIDWPDSEEDLDRFLKGTPMTSAIDELLEHLRNMRDFYAKKPGGTSLAALEFGRHIAAVEELVERKSVVSFAHLVEREPELAGMMPVSLHKYSPEELCRATVRATKKGILARLRESIKDGDPIDH